MSMVKGLDMPLDRDPSEEIFLEALSKPDTAARMAYLNQACGDDLSLRQRVEALLAAHNATGNFLKLPADEISTALNEGPGSKIGWYKLLEQIGEGGMGTVYMAQQTEPVARKVALKIIKPGMDSRQVIARFEAERQALALMDHQNIARMLDAGTTDTGRPYFVMELVKGVPIVQYCDQHRLPPRQRLELFITVCQAVQHAHQKGIIHRDLKPNNILVAEYDDRPVAKIIDFGVAKAVGQQLTERTMFTEFGQVVGTVEYMSPEQAKLNQLDIDTRSDIYSLGVLLYELLSGETPFDRQRLRSAAFDEMLRIIREEEPLTPSTRLITSKSLASIAANRQLEPKRLTAQLSGDLDWIVMRCLEKDRSRRYPTAIGLAEDLQHYLADEPVTARKPSRVYRLKKFVRRNRFMVVAVTAITTALLVGVTLAAVGLIEAHRQKQLAENQTLVADEATAHLHKMLGPISLDAENMATAWAADVWAGERLSVKDFKEALNCEVLALTIIKKILPPDHDMLDRVHRRLANILESAAKARVLIQVCSTGDQLAQVESYFHETPVLFQHKQGFDSQANIALGLLPGFPLLYLELADELSVTDEMEADNCRHRAAKLFDDAETKIGNDHRLLQWFYQARINADLARGQSDQAKIDCQKMLAVPALDEAILNSFAWKLVIDKVSTQHEPEVAVAIAQKAVEISCDFADHWNTLGVALYRAGQWQAAIDALNKSEDLHQEKPDCDWFFLAMAHWQLGQRGEARQWYEKAIKWMGENRPNDQQLRRFRDEAAELLGINPSPSTVDSKQ